MGSGGAIALLVFMALVIVGFGAVTLFLPDVDWSWTKFGNDLGGIKSERSEGYEFGRILRGIVAIGVGLFMAVFALTAIPSLDRSSAGGSSFSTAIVATPTAVARLATELAAANIPLPVPEPQVYVVIDTADPGGGYRLALAETPTERIEKRFQPIGFASVLCGPNETTALATAAAPADARERDLLLGQRVRIARDPLITTSSTYDEWVYLWTTADNTQFNRRMIAEGYYLANTQVSVSFYGAPYRYLADFRTAEDEARMARRGIWGNPACGLSLGTRVAEGNRPTPSTYRTPTPFILPTSRPDATPTP